jgi:hypothetical protein
MNTGEHSPPNFAALLDSLDPEAIRQRLCDLERESQAMRVLLRAARARKQPKPPQGLEVSRA